MCSYPVDATRPEYVRRKGAPNFLLGDFSIYNSSAENQICRRAFPAACSGRLKLYLLQQIIYLDLRICGVIMTVSEDEDEHLAHFLESEVLSEISDQVTRNSLFENDQLGFSILLSRF